jgi:hypothetical protein
MIFTCQPCKTVQNIILGVGNYIVTVPQQTLGRHVPSAAEQVQNSIDRLALNSHNGKFSWPIATKE